MENEEIKDENIDNSGNSAKLPVSCGCHSKVYVWAIVENIVTVAATAAIFIFTKSGLAFLLLINLNSVKTVKSLGNRS